MAFFRKWKTHYKHKKFTSDEAIDGEDWGLKKTGKCQQQPNDNLKIDIASIAADDEEDEVDNNKPLFATYTIKYLGCTPIENKRSEKIVSEAIKTVIANSKAGGRKNKSQKRVIVNLSQDGIEVLDEATQDSLMKFSIYKISYCSVDAAHDHAFSFVGSEVNPLTEQEKMSCHVFQCPKRKVAHEITLMVARCFEQAYQHWRESVVQHTQSPAVNYGTDKVENVTKNVLKEHNGIVFGGVIESRAEVHQQHTQKESAAGSGDSNKSDNLLIDLAASDGEVRQIWQQGWISFEEDTRDGQRIAAY